MVEEADDSVEVDDLHAYLVGSDPGHGSTDPAAIITELHHRHLPRMADAGVVEYDDRSDSVRYVGDALLEECLARSTQFEHEE